MENIPRKEQDRKAQGILNGETSAFPFVVALGERVEVEKGMSLREYLAGQALAGILASPVTTTEGKAMKAVAHSAVAMADAVLEALVVQP